MRGGGVAGLRRTRDQQDRGQTDQQVDHVRQHGLQRGELGERRRDRGPQGETGRERQGRPAGTRDPLRVCLVRAVGELLDPRGPHGHAQSQGQPGEDPAHEEQHQTPGAQGQQDAAHHREDGRGDHQGPPPVPVGQRSADQQGRDDPQDVRGQEHVHGHLFIPLHRAVHDEQRGELVATPRHRQQRRTDPHPGLHTHDTIPSYTRCKCSANRASTRSASFSRTPATISACCARISSDRSWTVRTAVAINRICRSRSPW